MSKIVTHPGGAHFDEFASCCLILALVDEPFTIERRQPTDEEIGDSDVWVVDVGLNYDPNLKNFDHHQDAESDCSFVLVADFLGVKSLLEKIPWWNVMNKLDTKGPTYVVKEMNLTTEEFLSLGSPLEKFMLDKFADNPNALIPIMREFGKKMLWNAKKFHASMERYEKCLTFKIKGSLFLLNESDDCFASQRYAEKSDPRVSAMIAYDDRGPGWSILRFADNNQINLSLIEFEPQIKFAHKNGFIAKTHMRIPLIELKELLNKTIQ